MKKQRDEAVKKAARIKVEKGAEMHAKWLELKEAQMKEEEKEENKKRKAKEILEEQVCTSL